MPRKLFTLPLLILVVGFAIVWLWPTAPVSAPVVLPTATPGTLPLCVVEDGSGQALCMWDASAQGNGMGNDVVSGECASDNHAQQDACVRLWDQGAYEYIYNGATIHVENGSVLVSECMDIEYEARMDSSIREQLNSDGWNLTECFEANMR